MPQIDFGFSPVGHVTLVEIILTTQKSLMTLIIPNRAIERCIKCTEQTFLES